SDALFRNAPPELRPPLKCLRRCFVTCARAITVAAGQHHVSEPDPRERFLIALHVPTRQIEASLATGLRAIQLAAAQIVEPEPHQDETRGLVAVGCEFECARV